MNRQDTLAVIAAGGVSSRMGFDKATAELAGKTMLLRVLEAVARSGLEAVIAGPHRPGISTPFISDPPGLRGPAAALVAAVRTYPERSIFLVATDQPYLRPGTVSGLLEVDGDVAIPVDVARQTLCAVYRPACTEPLEVLIAERADPSLQTLVDHVGATEVDRTVWQKWGEDGRSWLSIDSPDRLLLASESWPDPPRSLDG